MQSRQVAWPDPCLTCQFVTRGPPMSTGLQVQEGQTLAAFLSLRLHAATAPKASRTPTILCKNHSTGDSSSKGNVNLQIDHWKWERQALSCRLGGRVPEGRQQQ